MTFSAALQSTIRLVMLALPLIIGLVPQADALTVGPSRSIINGKPGEAYHGTYQVRNETEEELTVFIEPEDWTGGMNGERGTVEWLTLSLTQLTLPPGGEAEVPFVIEIPENASGELRAQVFFTTVSQSPSGSGMRSRLGTIVYVPIQGTTEVGAEILSATCQYAPATDDSKGLQNLTASMVVRNTGNVHILPEGRVEVFDASDTLVATLDMIGGWGLLPKESETYHARADGVQLPAGQYSFVASVYYGNDVDKPSRVSSRFGVEATEDGRLVASPEAAALTAIPVITEETQQETVSPAEAAVESPADSVEESSGALLTPVELTPVEPVDEREQQPAEPTSEPVVQP